MSKKNPFAPKSLDAVETKARPVAEKKEASVVDGTIKEVVEWVGDDLERAQKALDQENAKESPRSTLVSTLEGILESPEDEKED